MAATTHKKTFACAATAVGFSLMSSSAQDIQNPIEFRFATNRDYRQVSGDVIFLSGNMTLDLRDGFFTFLGGCPFNGGTEFFFPSQLPPCPIGATGVVLSGDFDGDGLRDDNTYWQILSVTPAALIEPSRPELVKFFAGPPSTLTRNLGPFSDANGVEIFFNLFTTTVRQSSITRYSYQRSYVFGERARADSDLPSGLYQFTFPRLKSPLTPVGFQVTHAPIPEGRRKYGNVWQGFRFIETRNNAEGFAELDPRIINVIKWEGTRDYIYPSADRLYFSIVRKEQNGDPLSPSGLPPYSPRGIVATDVAFPPPGVPGVIPRVLLPSPFDVQYIVPPSLREFSQPLLGLPPIETEAVVRLTLQRNLPSTNITFDRSTRTFELAIKYVDTYAGWAILNFPPASPKSITNPNADPDGDGFTNFEEWLNKTNPLVPDAPIAPLALRFVQTAAKKSDSAVTPGFWTMSFPKLAEHESALSYEVQFSDGDLSTWRTIGEDDAEWTVVNERGATELIVKSKTPELSGKGFFRVKTDYKP